MGILVLPFPSNMSAVDQLDLKILDYIQSTC